MTKPKKRPHLTQNQCTLYVEGMHCAACEILIEKKLLKDPVIESVDASISTGKVLITYTGDKAPDVGKLNHAVAGLDYRFSKQKPIHKNSPLFSWSHGYLEINSVKFRRAKSSVFTFLLLIIGFFIFERMQLGRYVSVDGNSGLMAFLLLGLIAGFSSCAALIGGLLLSLGKHWHEATIDADRWQTKAEPHILFHVGRLLGFFILGGVLGLLGDAVSLGNTSLFSTIAVLVSLYMLILALQMLEVGWARRLTITAPKWLTRRAAREDSGAGKFGPYLTGLLTFFLPCGFTLVAQGIALTSGSFLSGGLIMLFFALGTLPTLLSISFSGMRFTRKPHLTARFNLVAGLLILFFATYNINGQLNVLGLPSLSDIKLSAPTAASQVVATTNTEGVQVLNITAKDFDYIPTGSTTLKAGIPTKLIVDNEGILGCGSYLTATGMLDGYIPLKLGENVVEFTPKKGTYKLTCTMGMVRPVIINVV